MGDSLPKIASAVTILAIMLTGVAFVFNANATANEALRVANQNKADLARALGDKADKDDVQRLDSDINQLRTEIMAAMEERKR